MGSRGRIFVAVTSIAAALAGAGPAIASGPAPADPASNLPLPPLPIACDSAPGQAECVNAAVSYLDAGRTSLGQPAYVLPSDFVSLSAPEQAFVLTNLDRIQYGLEPIPGLTAALSQDASGGVQSDNDPSASDPNLLEWTANWAGGFPNMPLAYGAWMYDDGLGSGNLDCTAAATSGCWGHRQDILWRFGSGESLAMGAAAGTDHQGVAGFAMLLAGGDSSFRPVYTYTWSQALADGAGGPIASQPAAPAPTSTPPTKDPTSSAPTLTISSLRVSGRRVAVQIVAAPGAALSCSLTRLVGRRWAPDHFRRCSATTTYTGLRAGRYRLRVRATGALATRYLTIP